VKLSEFKSKKKQKRAAKKRASEPTYRIHERPACDWLCGYIFTSVETPCPCEAAQLTDKERSKMVKISEAFGGKYWKAAHVENSPAKLTIKGVNEEEVGRDKEEKLVVSFKEDKRTLVLNQVNGTTIDELAGSPGDTDGWTGTVVELYGTSTDFGGKRVPCIRVRKPVDNMDVPF
jgi:hypothetical protein